MEPPAIDSTRKAAFIPAKAHSRRVTRTDKKGKVEILADRWQGKRFNAPNDLAIRKEGDVYFTDPAFGNQQDTRELDFFGVYHISRKGELGSNREAERTPERHRSGARWPHALREQLRRAECARLRFG